MGWLLSLQQRGTQTSTTGKSSSERLSDNDAVFSPRSLELEDLRQSVLSGRVAAAARRDSLEVRRNSRAEAGALSRSGHVHLIRVDNRTFEYPLLTQSKDIG